MCNDNFPPQNLIILCEILFNLRGFEYLVVIDFEATCENRRIDEYPHEIIEFPAVLVNVLRWGKVGQTFSDNT